MNSHLVNVFSIEGQQFAIPINQIIRVVRAVEVTTVPHTPAGVLGVIDYYGALLPVMNLRNSLGLREKSVHPDDRFIIVRTMQRDIIIIADAVEDIIDIEQMKMIEGKDVVPGTSLIKMVRAEKGVVFIYDIEKLFRLDDKKAFEKMLETAANIEQANDIK